MLIDFKQAVVKHRMQIKGVIHVGAHYGQEYATYKDCGINLIVFIEPCKKAFEVLVSLFGTTPGVTLMDCACGAAPGEGIMNIETANKGMSNSLLKPLKHIQQYPSIQFTDTEAVEVLPLDQIAFGRSLFNLLVMDVQGYELEVLKGSIETIKNIDYIYTEVNRDEVYEGCAKVWELDAFLKDFRRVETNWGGGTWGDSIYIRQSLLK